MLPVFRDHEALHEVSGVKVPRPASPFITHETPMLLEGMAVAVSRGKCMDELIDISIWCVVE
jgi:hypothetical protein